jgi:hypothetical protein
MILTRLFKVIQYAHRLFHEPNFLSNRTEPDRTEPTEPNLIELNSNSKETQQELSQTRIIFFLLVPVRFGSTKSSVREKFDARTVYYQVISLI